MLFLSTDVIKKLHFFFSYTFVFFIIIFFFLFHLDKRLYSTSGGEVLFTKLDQEAEMDIKVTTTTKVLGRLLWEINVMRASDTCTGLRPGQYLTHAHRHITRHKVAMDSCFTLISAHLHSTAVRPLYVQWPNKGETGVYDYQSSQVVWLCACDQAHGLVYLCHLLLLHILGRLTNCSG